MKPLRALVWAAAFAALGGCAAESGRPRVAFVTNNPDEFWLFAEKGFEDEARKQGVTPEFRRPEKGTAAEQKQIIDTLLARGVKAIAVSVKDPENQSAYLDTVAAKAVLLTVDNDADKSKRKCYIGTDNVKAGRAVGQTEPLNARQRVEGVRQELGIDDKTLASKDGKYKLDRAEPHTDNVDQRVAKENASTVLIKLKDEPAGKLCLVGLWAYNPPAILSAVKDQKKEGKVVIVGFDEKVDTLRGIEDGHVYGTVVQDPYEFGRKSAEVMAKLAKGESVELPADGKDYIPERIVTRDGGDGREKASEFRPKVEAILKGK
jgi:ribose transport system substrate-binding protein